jgi:hypothetical protein
MLICRLELRRFVILLWRRAIENAALGRRADMSATPISVAFLAATR